MDSILEIGAQYNLIVIEDAAQAIVSIKLNYLDGWTETRQANADKYRELFIDAGLDDIVNLPTEKENRHIYNQFVISLKEKRDDLRSFLTDADIGTEVYYPVSMHLQDCFSNLNYRKGDFSVSEYAASHTLALPVYPELSYEQQTYLVEKIKEFYS